MQCRLHGIASHGKQNPEASTVLALLDATISSISYTIFNLICYFGHSRFLYQPLLWKANKREAVTSLVAIIRSPLIYPGISVSLARILVLLGRLGSCTKLGLL